MIPGEKFLQRPILAGQINFPVSLAPMVGLSHVGLRQVVREYLPEGQNTFWPTEMLSSWRLPKETLGETPETFLGEDENFLVPQILGNEEGPIRESVQKLVEWGAVAIDINMGCPVKKALRHNYGVALMGDPEYAAEVVRMTVRHAQVPVSVKLRAGLQNDVEFLLKFVRGLEAAGASWITLHPRLGAMKRRGAADWSQIRLVRESVRIPVVGNGDVQCVDDVFQMLEVSGCDAVMVGRALAARPWLLWQVGERLGCPAPPSKQGQKAPCTPEEEGVEYGRALLSLLRHLKTHFVFAAAQTRVRFHVRMTGGWLEWGQNLYSLVCKATDFESLERELEQFFRIPQKMVARTNLRE